MSLVSELRRRNVLRMAVLYLIAAWLLMQVAEVLIDLGNLPDWIGPTVLWLLAIGFPIALIFSWLYELTPAGISLEKDVVRDESITHITGRRLDFIVISMLCAAVILFAYDKWWTPGPPEKSVAVLPFTNLSGDPDQEYFSDGISEELLNVLAQLPGMHVPARTSSFQFKGRHEDIATIAEALNVTHVLEGSVRMSGNRLRITAQLIKADNGFHLWSQSYDRELDDVFAVQDEIAIAISDVLKVKLAIGNDEPVQPAVIKAAHTDAYHAYLQGRELIRHRGQENMRQAIEHFERALRLDSNFAPAHAQMAIAVNFLGYYGALSLQEVNRVAIPHLKRAQELEPDLPEVHAGWALLALGTNDPEATIEHARKALASNPSYSDAINWSFNAFLDLGRYEDAEAAIEQLLIVDPLSLVGGVNYAEWLALTGRIEEAHEVADRLLELDPRSGYFSHGDTAIFNEGQLAEGLAWALRAGHHFNAMWVLIWVGEYDEARRIGGSDSHWVDYEQGRREQTIQIALEGLQLNPESSNQLILAGSTLFEAGRIDEAMPLFERAFQLTPKGRPLSEPIPLFNTMWLALARRKTGDENGAQAVAGIVRQDHAARREAGIVSPDQHLVGAMIAAFDNDPAGVVAALRSAVRRGLRNRSLVLSNPVFQDSLHDARIIALLDDLDAVLAEEHGKVLQLICFNNPVPDDWQPLPETCEGVVDQQVR